MYFVDRGVKHPLQIKAVNAIARNEQAAANKADSSKTSPGIQSGRPQTALQKDAWTRSVAAKTAMQAPASPRLDSQNASRPQKQVTHLSRKDLAQDNLCFSVAYGSKENEPAFALIIW